MWLNKSMNKGIIFIVLGIIILGGAIVFFAKSPKISPTPLPEGIVLFYGEECPHCKDVEDFISVNKIDEKLKITKLEVWHNQGNALLVTSLAISCGQNVEKGVPVPFLYNGKNCLVGSPDIINFLKNEAGIK